MPIVRKNELKSLDAKGLKVRKEEMRKELMKLKAQSRTGVRLESPGRIRALRKNIARILTFAKLKGVEKL